MNPNTMPFTVHRSSSWILSITQKSVGFYFRIPCLPIIPFHERKKTYIKMIWTFIYLPSNVQQMLNWSSCLWKNLSSFFLPLLCCRLSIVGCRYQRSKSKQHKAQAPHTYKPYTRCHTNIRFQSLALSLSVSLCVFFIPVFYLLILDQMLMQLKVDQCLRSEDLKDVWFSASNKRDKNETEHEFLWSN